MSSDATTIAIKALSDTTESLQRQVNELKTQLEASKRGPPQRVALLTAGGLAPCLSSAIGALVQKYTEFYPQTSIICYLGGYKGLLLGDSITLNKEVRKNAQIMHQFGGSAIGNSRVKLTNVKDCIKRGLVKEGEDPQAVAAAQLVKDGIDILHTIGGDDTNTAAADLAAFLARNNYNLTVIGMPKTIDNDVFPIKQSLGAWTAAEEGAKFFKNVVAEYSANPRMFIVHEVMGRDCGYLCAATAKAYRDLLDKTKFAPAYGVTKANYDVHAVYLPEIPVDIEAEAWRLKRIMDQVGNVNIFISEGAGVKDIVREMEALGQEVPRDAFGHVKLDKVNPGKWFAQQFSEMIGAQKTMVQKSGYYSRAAPPNAEDRRLIQACASLAVDCAVRREGGVTGHDEDHGELLRACEFPRIKGHKAFDTTVSWFLQMQKDIGLYGTEVTSVKPEPPMKRPKISLKTAPKKIGILTAGGLAPCLSSAIGALVERYGELHPNNEIVCYRGGYKGLLLGDSFTLDQNAYDQAHILHSLGGSPIGNSRVKLTNVKDCVKRGLVKEGEDPQAVAANQLVKDGIDVLHTIGGDDTNTAAADLAAYLQKNNYKLSVVGMPKTIDNDVYPIKQSLGAWTAAEEGGKFFLNVVAEHSANPRMLIVHEVMGRDCGYLTAATAKAYRDILDTKTWLPGVGLNREAYEVHAVFIPEVKVDINGEAIRLKKIMDRLGCVNIFISEGAGVKDIVKEMESRGEEVPRDAFGHVKLDAVNPGEWFGKQFAAMLDAEKTLIQKSGYYSRASPSNKADLRLIQSSAALAVDCAMRGESGVIGHDEDQGDVLRAIEFPRIKGGKPFNTTQPWFGKMLMEIGQTGHMPTHLKAPVGDASTIQIVHGQDIVKTSTLSNEGTE
uniref:Pyrophosphate--fructose 6-phosphate 1-phosphotransferase n=1 Tax=Eutreptiella gymnastica TaxID=73025 RepID=A0A6U8FQ77_9EUGL